MEDFKHHVAKLEDDANTKASVVRVSREILPGLAGKYHIEPRVTGLIQQLVQDLIIESHVTNLPELESVAGKAVNNAMEEMGLEYPGFTKEYLTKMKESLLVRAAPRV